tara:strand:+ start:790 stop:1029 length:240 start_codon:yes stop_codon:yes gene_type:complete
MNLFQEGSWKTQFLEDGEIMLFFSSNVISRIISPIATQQCGSWLLTVNTPYGKLFNGKLVFGELADCTQDLINGIKKFP